MLDLSKNDPAALAEVGYTFKLELPDGTVTDAEITVRGANSAKVKNFARKLYQEFKVKEQQAKRRGKEPEDLSLEEAEDLAAETASVRVVGWKGIAEGGKEIAYSNEEAIRVLKAYPFIREQVMEASDNIFNFTKS